MENIREAYFVVLIAFLAQVSVSAISSNCIFLWLWIYILCIFHFLVITIYQHKINTSFPCWAYCYWFFFISFLIMQTVISFFFSSVGFYMCLCLFREIVLNFGVQRYNLRARSHVISESKNNWMPWQLTVRLLGVASSQTDKAEAASCFAWVSCCLLGPLEAVGAWGCTAWQSLGVGMSREYPHCLPACLEAGGASWGAAST